MFDFGEHLKQLRQFNGITQKQLALDIGASERGIQNYELGERKPTYDILIALANYFDVPLDYLVGRGVFENWDQIMSHKDAAIDALLELLPPNTFNKEELLNASESTLIRLFPVVFHKIDYDVKTDTLVLYPYAPV